MFVGCDFSFPFSALGEYLDDPEQVSFSQFSDVNCSTRRRIVASKDFSPMIAVDSLGDFYFSLLDHIDRLDVFTFKTYLLRPSLES